MQMFHLPSAKVFVILLWPNIFPRNRPTPKQGELTLKLPPNFHSSPHSVIRDQIMKARYAYESWNLSFTGKYGWGILWTSKIVPSLFIMLKPEAYRREEMRQADSPRQSCWMQSAILVLSSSPCCSGIASSMTPIVTMLWSLCLALQTLNICPHQPDVPTSHPKCVFHSFQIYYYFLGLSSSLHRFLPGVFYSTKLAMPCPAAPYLQLPMFICINLNPWTEPNRTPSIISCIIFVFHSLQSGALRLCLGNRQPIPSA